MGEGVQEMEIRLEVQTAIDQCIVCANSLGGISISEFLSALGTESGEPKITENF